MRAMHATGFANQPISTSRRDGLSCATPSSPPPSGARRRTTSPRPRSSTRCQPFLEAEWNACRDVRVVVPRASSRGTPAGASSRSAGMRLRPRPRVRPRRRAVARAARWSSARFIPAGRTPTPAGSRRRCWRASSTPPAPPSADRARPAGGRGRRSSRPDGPDWRAAGRARSPTPNWWTWQGDGSCSTSGPCQGSLRRLRHAPPRSRSPCSAGRQGSKRRGCSFGARMEQADAGVRSRGIARRA